MSQQSHEFTSASGQSRSWLKWTIAALVLVLIGTIWGTQRDQLSLARMAEHETDLRRFQQESPWLVYGIAFAIYVAVTGLSLPGAAPLTLLMAWYFGFWRAVVLVSFASTTGATLAFLLSRYLFRDSIERRFSSRLSAFYQALEREGAFYLFTLRLIPAVPFFVINAVMGLTRLRVWTFWWVSQVGMLAGTCVYVYAGSSIPSLSQLADPSQLRSADILDWPGFVKLLQSEPSSQSGDSSAERPGSAPVALRRALTLPTGRMVNAVLDGESIGDSLQAAVIADINSALQNPGWVDIGKPEQTGGDERESATETSRAIDTDMTAARRAWLVRELADYIGSPQPIISWKLLAAFALLGCFPFVVRRLMARFRSPVD